MNFIDNIPIIGSLSTEFNLDEVKIGGKIMVYCSNEADVRQYWVREKVYAIAPNNLFAILVQPCLIFHFPGKDEEISATNPMHLLCEVVENITGISSSQIT